MQRVWRPFLLLGVLATGAYFALPDGLPRDVDYQLIGYASVFAIVFGVRRYRPESPGLWYLIAAGQLMFVLGDLAFSIFEDVLHREPPIPSIADALYYLGYPLVAIGLIVLIRRRSPGQDRRSLIDATVIAVGLGLLAWVFLIKPYALTGESALLEGAVLAGYPVLDILLVAVVAKLAVSRGVRVPAYYLLGSSLLLLLVSDSIYLYQGLNDTYTSSSLSNAGYLLSYLLVGAAALHVSMPRLVEHDPLPGPKISWGRLVWLGGASLAAPAALAVQHVRHEPIDVWVIVAGSAVLFLLVLYRMAGLLREVESTAEELEFQGSALKATLAELQDAAAERRRLLDRVLSASDEERMRLAAELHDGPIQRLATVQYGLERGRLHLERGSNETAAKVFKDVTQQLSRETHALRRLMAELRPPALDESGLVGAVRDQVVGFERQTGVDCDFQANLQERLDPELETVLYRVIQEALTNVSKHAQAQHVTVTLRAEDGSILLDVADDGVGFDRTRVGGLARNGHIGLVAMRERVEMAGGKWSVDSSPKGTSVHVAFQAAEKANA